MILQKGPLIPDSDKPEVPPNDQCDGGWHYDVATTKCYYFHSADQGWQAAADYCKSTGGDMVSVNSPEEQNGVWQLGALMTSGIGNLLTFYE